ncbi:hypothetical protein KUCAC02_016907, partial [Chaenocephalus aceratus]
GSSASEGSVFNAFSFERKESHTEPEDDQSLLSVFNPNSQSLLSVFNPNSQSLLSVFNPNSQSLLSHKALALLRCACIPSLKDARFQLVNFSDNELKVSLSNVSLSDEGRYVCQLYTDPPQEAYADITVL